jgi:hypothetical protein
MIYKDVAETFKIKFIIFVSSRFIQIIINEFELENIIPKNVSGDYMIPIQYASPDLHGHRHSFKGRH